ncbi:hypothetical protein KP509_20G089500 [Ceratopteris richardii]|uniref:EF-hand domain-containing protein n=1 Tax=Ceratopteris richardii TaxID=49495 RepID=A0A8T2SJC6_CERRI|nr:hypothetical protein KP509_20G089500 [Ceratopteris richardii]KAH7332478.1 hypothetical protein KP509_20G089500 [Ceratopteris richardii]KAH7332479.1 hypothetical protein KP509_20G089500 [Ceratopteris richardii]
MGAILGKHTKSHGPSKLERRMVNAMKERGTHGKNSVRTFNSIIMMFPKIDKTFEAVRTTFEKFDKNGNGTLELEELKDCFKELHITLTDEEIKDLFSESDMDASSGIDFKEFIVLLSLVHLLSSSGDKSNPFSARHGVKLGLTELEESFDKIADTFVFFDKDCDGYVSKKEIVEAIGQSTPVARNASRIGLKRFEEMDWDKNGLITFKEFLFVFTNWVGVEDDEESDDSHAQW